MSSSRVTGQSTMETKSVMMLLCDSGIFLNANQSINLSKQRHIYITLYIN